VSGPAIGAEQALEAALLARLAEDADVKAALGQAPRVFDAAEAKPLLPYLEIARHTWAPAGGAEAEASEHRVDIAILSRVGGRTEVRAALAAARAALASGLEMAGWRCVLLAPIYADTLAARPGMYRALLRVKAIIEPVAI
jgi:hypothetical protein